jgi:hypothetical protein
MVKFNGDRAQLGERPYLGDSTEDGAQNTSD